MINWVVASASLVLLLLAGDALVKGAVNLSLRLGVQALIVSLTIVAFGTSAPELLISVQASLENAPGIALGNVVGSNTANILLVLGIPAILSTMRTSDCETRMSYVQMILASGLFIALSLGGELTRTSGAILLVALVAMLYYAFLEARRHRASCNLSDAEEDVEGADPDMPWAKVLLMLGLGLIGLPIGAGLLVDSSVAIARDFGISETAIGLTLVAIGTSLPELATTVMAAVRRQADVALGNVIGSNMFNLLGIMGIASLIHPIPVDPIFIEFDFWIMLGASLLLVPFVFFRKDLTRGWGIALTALYTAYIVVVLG
jgi:cation:H+ antiporter